MPRKPSTRAESGPETSESAAIPAPFEAPPKGSEEYEAWLDGPRPEAGNGRGQWLRARQLRGSADGSGAKGEGAAPGRTVEPNVQPERDADDLRHLDGIIHSASALASDRIRAIEAKQRILNRNEAEALTNEHGPLVALRAALEALPVEERSGTLVRVLRVEEQGASA